MAGGAPGGPRPSVLRSPFLWAFLVGIVILTLIRPCLRRVPAPPPVQGRLPEFSFVDQEGARFGRERLRGSVVIVNFFRVGCDGGCAAAMKTLAEIAKAYADLRIDGIRLLSLSIDPVGDTPERLRAYGAGMGADPEHWILASGDAAGLQGFAAAAFGLTAPDAGQDAAGGAPPEWLVRAGRVLIVDPDGNLRGTYADDATGLDEVYNRAQHVRDAFRGRGGSAAGAAGGGG